MIVGLSKMDAGEKILTQRRKGAKIFSDNRLHNKAAWRQRMNSKEER
jgi:hypothetical protein